jgi:putative thioredoxin
MISDGTNAFVQDVDDIDFADAVLEQSFLHPIVVDFWAPWCGPCRTLGPSLERLAAAGNGTWTLAKVNVDQNQQLAQRFHVQGIPAVKAFVNGKQVAEFTGAIPESQITQWLAGFVPQPIDDSMHTLDTLALTNVAAALQGYAALVSMQPQNDAARIGYARLLIRRNDSDASTVLRAITPHSVYAEQAAGWLVLAAAAQEVYSDDDTCAPLYITALQAFIQQDVTAGIAGMLDLVVRARSWNDEAARKTYLAMLQTLGTAHPLIAQARRDLASALF